MRTRPAVTDQTPPHVVIVGAGFGGMETARRLARAPVRITLIDRQNYHLFQPLLYQVAIAGLVPSQIAYPIRTIFRRQKNLTFRMGEVTAVDFDARFVKMDGSVMAYDYLVLAIGGQTNFFGLTSVEQNAHQLKNVSSAIQARNHLLKMFELASHEADDEAAPRLADLRRGRRRTDRRRDRRRPGRVDPAGDGQRLSRHGSARRCACCCWRPKIT